MSSKRYVVLTLVILLGLVAGIAPSAPAAAGGATITVVATGLNNPRHLNFGSDGALYVAESGKGGAGPCTTGPEGGRQCYGATGSITRIANGTQRRVVTGLPSFADPAGMFASGPTDVTVVPAASTTQQAPATLMYILVGGGNRTLATNARRFGMLLLRTPDGVIRNSADITGYEQRVNPDRGAIDSNPYALMTLPGRHIVADAGGNSILQVNRSDGRISTVGVLGNRLVRGPGGTMISMQAVPTALAYGPDRAYYIGQLTGFPFPVNGARVYRKVPGQPMTVFRYGFTNIIDIDFGPDGSLYVLEIVKGGLLNVDENDPATLTGRLVRVYPNGTRITIATTGLVAPGGLEVAGNGTVYVSNYSIFAGRGQVLRIRQ